MCVGPLSDGLTLETPSRRYVSELRCGRSEWFPRSPLPGWLLVRSPLARHTWAADDPWLVSCRESVDGLNDPSSSDADSSAPTDEFCCPGQSLMRPIENGPVDRPGVQVLRRVDGDVIDDYLKEDDAP
jgi:hypothetical protein